MNNNQTVLIAIPEFAKTSTEPLNMLKKEGFNIVFNDTDEELKPDIFKKYFSNASYVVAGLEIYDSSFFKEFRNIKVISRVGIGIDTIDLISAEKYDVKIYNTPDAPSKAVSELTIGLIVNLNRKLFDMHSAFIQGDWAPILGKQIDGQTLGIIGLGRIGKLVAITASSMGMKILAHDIVKDLEFTARYGIKYCSLSKLLNSSNVVSMHLPLYDDTFHFIDEKELLIMKQNAIIINTSRGGIINDNALVKQLHEGRFYGVALDVFEKERRPDLYKNLPRTIFLPHIGSSADKSRIDMEVGAVKNIIRYHRSIES